MSVLAGKIAAVLAACGEDITVADVGAGVHRVVVAVADVGLASAFGEAGDAGVTHDPVLVVYAPPDTTIAVGSTFTRDGVGPYTGKAKYVGRWANQGTWALVLFSTA